MSVGLWRVVSVNRVDETVGLESADLGQCAANVRVPSYLPLPEPNSMVTSDGTTVIAVVRMPSYSDLQAQVELDSMPARGVGDTVIKYPNSGFVAWLKSQGELVLGRALQKCHLKFNKEGIEMFAKTLRYCGVNAHLFITSSDPEDPTSTPDIQLGIGEVLQLSAANDRVVLHLLSDMFMFELSKDDGLKISTMSNKGTGDRVTIFEEDFKTDNNSSQTGKKTRTFESELLFKAMKKVVVDCAEAFYVQNASDLILDSAGAAALQSQACTSISGEKAVQVTSPDIALITKGSSNAGTIDMLNGTMSGMKFDNTGNVGIGALKGIYLGGFGDNAVSADNLETWLGQLITCTSTIAQACGPFCPTSGAAPAIAQLEVLRGLLTSGIVRQRMIHYPAKGGPLMPTPSVFVH